MRLGPATRQCPGRLSSDQLVDAQVPAEEVFTQGGRRDEEDRRRANPRKPASPGTKDRGSHENQGGTRQQEAESGIGLHRDRAEAPLAHHARQPGDQVAGADRRRADAEEGSYAMSVNSRSL